MYMIRVYKKPASRFCYNAFRNYLLHVRTAPSLNNELYKSFSNYPIRHKVNRQRTSHCLSYYNEYRFLQYDWLDFHVRYKWHEPDISCSVGLIHYRKLSSSTDTGNEKTKVPNIDPNARTVSVKNTKTNASKSFNSQQDGDGPGKTTDQNVSSKNKSLFKKVRSMIDIFWHGCKALFHDVRIALRSRRKLGLYHQPDFSRLSREEVRHMRQTKLDVVKTFPVALLFMIPFIGYAAPILAYFYPKQLLSRQFWHPDQKKVFILEEYEKRSQYYLPLVKEVGMTCKEINCKTLLDFCLRTLDGVHPSTSELLTFRHAFAKHDDFSLQKMPRYHLVKLCKCWLIPTGWYLPRWFLMNALKRRIARLHEDDMLIVRDGIDFLNPECIEQAVHVRGLDETSLCDTAKLHWLTEWIKLSCQVSEDDVAFLAHSAVFKAANFEAIEKQNGRVSE